MSFDQAIKSCTEQDKSSTLVVINSNEEQVYINNYLDSRNASDSVWVGFKQKDGSYKSIDNNNVSYINWALGYPVAKSSYDCVQLNTHGVFDNKWTNEPCSKKNLVFCQKPQTWSFEHLQSLFIENKKQQQVIINKLETELLNIRNNPVPIGFIYIEYYNRKPPSVIWPGVKWTDVTANYAGQFFRALGGGSSPFGSIQDDSTRHISQIKRVHTKDGSENINLVDRNWSPPLYIMATGPGEWFSYQFYIADNEVRPKNQAIRIWERTA